MPALVSRENLKKVPLLIPTSEVVAGLVQRYVVAKPSWFSGEVFL